MPRAGPSGDTAADQGTSLTAVPWPADMGHALGLADVGEVEAEAGDLADRPGLS